MFGLRAFVVRVGFAALLPWTPGCAAPEGSDLETSAAELALVATTPGMFGDAGSPVVLEPPPPGSGDPTGAQVAANAWANAGATCWRIDVRGFRSGGFASPLCRANGYFIYSFHTPADNANDDLAQLHVTSASNPCDLARYRMNPDVYDAPAYRFLDRQCKERFQTRYPIVRNLLTMAVVRTWTWNEDIGAQVASLPQVQCVAEPNVASCNGAPNVAPPPAPGQPPVGAVL